MKSQTSRVFEILGTSVVAGAGSALGKDLYQLVKEFLVSRSPAEQHAVLASRSIKAPATFVAFEVDRLSHEAAVYLLSLSLADRQKLIESARQVGNGTSEQTLLNLLRFVQERQKKP
jgi:hypothetical protein